MNAAGRKSSREEGEKRAFSRDVRCLALQGLFLGRPHIWWYWFQRDLSHEETSFLRILHAITESDAYFVQKMNVAGKLGLSILQKAMAAKRMLAYETSSKAHTRMAENTAEETMLRWCRGVKRCFTEYYLQDPSQDDIVKQMEINQEQGWPSMFGFIDFMHYKWKLCPVALQ